MIAFLAQATEADALGTITVSALTVQMIVSLFIPIVTGILTKSTLSGFAKGLLTLVLNGINAAVVQATIPDGGAAFSKETIIMTAMGLAISVASYAGIYKPANVTSNAGGKLLPQSGLG